jgi:hypothetical protein
MVRAAVRARSSSGALVAIVVKVRLQAEIFTRSEWRTFFSAHCPRSCSVTWSTSVIHPRPLARQLEFELFSRVVSVGQEMALKVEWLIKRAAK